MEGWRSASVDPEQLIAYEARAYGARRALRACAWRGPMEGCRGGMPWRGSHGGTRRSPGTGTGGGPGGGRTGSGTGGGRHQYRHLVAAEPVLVLVVAGTGTGTWWGGRTQMLGDRERVTHWRPTDRHVKVELMHAREPLEVPPVLGTSDQRRLHLRLAGGGPCAQFDTTPLHSPFTANPMLPMMSGDCICGRSTRHHSTSFPFHRQSRATDGLSVRTWGLQQLNSTQLNSTQLNCNGRTECADMGARSCPAITVNSTQLISSTQL